MFDEAAAASVLAAFERQGTDLAIDLEHDSVDTAARRLRSDAADARGWVPRLELVDGWLYADGVTWTRDGARRLTERTQRYISPVTFFDEESKRITEIFNLALVSQPATYNAHPLVAGRTLSGDEMDPELKAKALEALQAHAGEAALEILKAMLVGAPEEAPADDAGEPPAEAASEPPDQEEEPAQASALAAALRPMLGKASASAIVAEVRAMRAELDALRLLREADEIAERQTLVGELVRLGAELPATAWADADKRVPVDALRAMPLDALRSRVAAFRAAPRNRAVAPPTGAPDATALSAADRARAALIKDESARARFVAARLSRVQ